ncbi:Pre-mRNA-splicing factor 38 [Chionoecetes opilio]|uniref:Pre-mRNA-splicing factor 38 n=1 Tax=Chionoecetes opilio TaxID=41210 RepID=A0A8J4XPE2_CHIOP|nr:Pre-mRNA-splicing factor 38 [Chionoecetes opilio]
MANRTVKDANSIHGTNPQYLVEKIIRTRIYDSRYWKEECFALSAELLVDKAMALRVIGGVFGGNIKPTPFLCLVLKMLQIQPEKDIIVEFIKQDEFKYVRALGAFYLRLVYGSLDCYKYLEPLLNDYRKLRFMDRSGVYQLSHMDEFIDILLRDERFCDIILPRMQKRWVHEANNELDGRVSLLEDDLDDLESESDEEEMLAPPPRPRTEVPDPTRPAARDDRHGRGHSPSRRSPQRDMRNEREREKRNPAGHHPHHHRERGRGDHRHPERIEKEHGGKERNRERERERGEPGERKEKHHRSGRSKRDKNSRADLEIAEANALRAKLGMPPLVP